MTYFDTIQFPTECDVVVVFTDFTGFAKGCQNKSNREIFEMMSEYYELVGDMIDAGGGKIIKFIGDSTLMVFPAEIAKQAVETLKELKEKSDAWLIEQGIDGQLQVKAHVGPVMCGLIGTKHDKRLDVFGNTVNQTALLNTGNFVLSTELNVKITSE